MNDFLRFGLTVFFILLGLFGAWFGLKLYGQSQPVSTYQTALVQKLISQQEKAPLTWSSQPGNPQLFAKVQFSETSWTINKQALTEFLAENSFDSLLLFIELDSPKALPELRKIFNQHDYWKKTIFCSRADGILKDLRELEPQWSFCSGEIFMTRFLAASSLQLESLLNISADVVFIHLDNIPLSPSFHQLIKEAKRQNKLVIMGPVTRPLESYKPHGWLVENKSQKVGP